MSRSALKWLLLAIPLGFLAAKASAADEPRLKPFVLAQRSTGTMDAAVQAVRAKLAGSGFEVAGAYSPYPDATVIVVTSPELRSAAARNKFGAYGAIQRVSVTRVGSEVQVAYTNPLYMKYAYRMEGDLAPVAAKLEATLGRIEEFGAEGLTPKELGKYHYMIGMEYFDEPTILGRFGSHGGAVKATERGLAKGASGASLVYKVAIPESNETVIGVALTEGCSADTFIMSEIDARPVRSTAHLPYEIVVSGMNAYALYGRFRIAINFPDLKMMGSNSFMGIKCAPEAIEAALKDVVWGEIAPKNSGG